MHLPLDDRSVKVARDEVAARLQDVGWSTDAVERARVVASELATNALVHGGSGFELEVRVDADAHQVWIGVADEAGGARPAYADRNRTRAIGFELALVRDQFFFDFGDVDGKPRDFSRQLRQTVIDFLQADRPVQVGEHC